MTSLFNTFLLYSGIWIAAWRSFKLIKSKNNINDNSNAQIDTSFESKVNEEMLTIEKFKKNEKYKEILKAWVNMAIVNVYNTYLHAFFAMIIPFYDTFYSVFLIWLIIPETRGNLAIYESLSKPLFRQNENRIEEKILPLFSSLLRSIGACIEQLFFSKHSLAWLTEDELTTLGNVYTQRIETIHDELSKRSIPITKVKEIDYSPPTIEEKDDSIKDFEENYFRKAYKNLTTPVSRAEKKINGSPESLASQSSWFGATVTNLLGSLKGKTEEKTNHEAEFDTILEELDEDDSPTDTYLKELGEIDNFDSDFDDSSFDEKTTEEEDLLTDKRQSKGRNRMSLHRPVTRSQTNKK